MSLFVRFENKFHALVECKVAQKTWRLTSFAESFNGMIGPDMLTVFQDLAKKMSRTDFELIAITCWIIWKVRNKYLFEAKKLKPQMSVLKAEAIIEVYQRTKTTELIHIDKEKSKAKMLHHRKTGLR